MKQYDKPVAIVFALLLFVLFAMASLNTTFFNWVYDRHQNQLSWFIRPLFLIPFCYFAYLRSWSGISFTLFCLFTSMFWFNKPEVVDERVLEFLRFEKEWLTGEWGWKKILLVFTVPFSFTALAMAFWKRSLWMGLAVVVLMAVGKIIWSIQNAGESGKSILIPAVAGLILCSFLIFYGYKRLERKRA